MLKVIHRSGTEVARRPERRERANDDAPWLRRFMADAEVLATSENARRVLPMLHHSLANVGRLDDCNPHHHEWRRIAIIAQILVCNVNEEAEDANVYAAMLRMRRFLDENEDLLDFTTLATA